MSPLLYQSLTIFPSLSSTFYYLPSLLSTLFYLLLVIVCLLSCISLHLPLITHFFLIHLLIHLFPPLRPLSTSVTTPLIIHPSYCVLFSSILHPPLLPHPFVFHPPLTTLTTLPPHSLLLCRLCCKFFPFFFSCHRGSQFKGKPLRRSHASKTNASKYRGQKEFIKMWIPIECL